MDNEAIRNHKSPENTDDMARKIQDINEERDGTAEKIPEDFNKKPYQKSLRMK